ncbi:MAG: hypothetical protein GX141_08030 [Armatimonadetes bacterium]|jgi:hypothetical protein|nr:hypothetical protein [Armatimonadota bacterium]
MSFSKLKKIHIIIIGSVLCVLVGVAVFFLMIKPQREAFAAAKARYDKAVVKGNEQSKRQAKAALAKAMMDYSVAQAQLDVQMRQRMPDLDFSRRDLGMLALWNEQIKTLGPLLEDFAHDKNVKVANAKFQIQPPPANPNDPVFAQDVLVFPLGSIAVQGGFKPLMENIRRWNNCSRLIMVGRPTLAGVSPQLTAVYPLTCYIFPKAKGGSLIDMAGNPDSSQNP